MLKQQLLLTIVVAVFTLACLSRPALAEDAVAGEKIFRKCKACHSLEEGKNRVGPSLFGVVGRRPGSVEGYRYSKAMRAFGEQHVWTEDALTTYLADPRGVVKGTKMSFRGLPDRQNRVDLIAYLKTLAP